MCIMAVTFDVDEVFEMAGQIERNGGRFYRKAAEGTADKEVKKLLEDFVVMEVAHEKTFIAMRADLCSTEGLPVDFDPDDEVAMYLRAMVDMKVIDGKADPSERLTGRETTQDILNIALGLEKDAIVFYLGIKEYVPAEYAKDRIRAIIRQEMGHIAVLNDQFKTLGQ